MLSSEVFRGKHGGVYSSVIESKLQINMGGQWLAVNDRSGLSSHLNCQLDKHYDGQAVSHQQKRNIVICVHLLDLLVSAVEEKHHNRCCALQTPSQHMSDVYPTESERERERFLRSLQQIQLRQLSVGAVQISKLHHMCMTDRAAGVPSHL